MNTIKLIFYFLFAVFMAANLASGNILNVPSQYSTIQSAINASVNADTVVVLPGTYTENINFRGKKIVLTSKFYLTNDYSFLQTTIINGSNPQFPDTASCVVFNRNEDSTTVLQGFTLTGGKGTKWTDEHGAGLYREGGGILIAYSSPVIQFNIITGNQAITGGVTSTGGGGMRIGDCFARVRNNIITNNTARYGAGVVLNYKNYGSLDFGAGSGLWVNGSNTRPKIVENNTIVFNSALSASAGVFGYFGNSSTFKNNIIWGNTSPSLIQLSASGITVVYCDVQGGTSGTGNINLDPMFDSTNYYIRSNSPCVDKGDSSSAFNDPADPGNPLLAKFPSKGGLRNDIGAYGGPGSNKIANSIVGIKSLSGNLSPEKFYLNQNYPNPFNPGTVISYQLKVSSLVTLKVYDVSGKIVATLVNEKKNAGSYEVKFDGSNLSSGIYFYTINAGDFVETKQMILLK
ncbi:MAG TPA: T9SS type A sorting domain-containing protein [Ignavibacteria bacterium]|nr:T9SS type A sorting domain-containing protein [Ignavibacteria bacterium]